MVALPNTNIFNLKIRKNTFRQQYGFVLNRLHQNVSFIKICLTPNFSDITEATSIPVYEPSTSANSSRDQTLTITKTQLMRECTSAARANNFLDKFSTPQFSKAISNTNATHDKYQ